MFWQSEELKYIAISIFILLIAFLLSKLFRRIFQSALLKSSNVLKVNATNYSFLKNAVTFIIYLVAIIVVFYTIPSLREIGITLLASAGIFAAILGLASQQAFSNIVSGIFIVIFKPFRVDDIIVVQQNSGIVEDITLRHTIIRNFENRRVIIPNSIISNETLLNSTITDSKICNHFECGISYDSDVDKAILIIREEVKSHPNFIDNRSDEQIQNSEDPVVIRLINWGDSSVNLRAYIWTEDSYNGFILKCDLYYSIKKRFDNEGIEIPFPHRKIVLKEKQ